MNIHLIVGARPNFMKAAAILEAAKDFPQLKFRMIHTAQHFGEMSDPYFQDLELPKPDTTLQIPQMNTAVERLGAMIVGLDDSIDRWDEKFLGLNPDYVMVVGDTDSTLAGALVAAKNRVPLIHVEAGLRCGDMRMQEEINRIIIDRIAQKHYATSEWALANLQQDRCFNAQLVGNVMIDTLYRLLPKALTRYKRNDRYAVLTLHRAENVDDLEKLNSIIGCVDEIARDIPVIWPVHPRVRETIKCTNIVAVPPMGYLQFIALLNDAVFVMTDSGGIQDETTGLGTTCLTLRKSTERPETVYKGSNLIIGTEPKSILENGRYWASRPKHSSLFRPPLWDGQSAHRILEDLCKETS